MSFRLFLLSLFVALFMAVPAHAVLVCPAGDDTCGGADNATPNWTCDSMNVDQCMFNGDPSSGGNYGVCAAYASAGQMCQWTTNVNGVTVCSSVAVAAKCYCDEHTHALAGNCVYYK